MEHFVVEQHADGAKVTASRDKREYDFRPGPTHRERRSSLLALACDCLVRKILSGSNMRINCNYSPGWNFAVPVELARLVRFYQVISLLTMPAFVTVYFVRGWAVPVSPWSANRDTRNRDVRLQFPSDRQHLPASR